ncbi:hypothetical protein M2102_000510 [Fusobacterium sp. PH5-7]|uniref:hypothetical protein n=1 Tax=Fusobacterium sp. PH5-7 TaxID=2940528 RepID=UPI0024730C49|nr:hypothetical protein [Fusobacterium sp. PH5-7]MDH6456895.1 hypothetical protein [Fusobacterium sp. PH5-7]
MGRIKRLSYTLNTDGTCIFHSNEINAVYSGNACISLPKEYSIIASAFRTTHDSSYGLGIFSTEEKSYKNLISFIGFSGIHSLNLCTIFKSNKIVCRALGLRGSYSTVNDIVAYLDVPHTSITVNCLIIISN